MTKHKPIPPIIDHNDAACMILGAYVIKDKKLTAQWAAEEAAEKAKQAALNPPPKKD